MNSCLTEQPRGRVPAILLASIACGCLLINILVNVAQSAIVGLLSCFSVAAYVMLIVYAAAFYGQHRARKMLPTIWLLLLVGQVVSWIYSIVNLMTVLQEASFEILFEIIMNRAIFIVPTLLLTAVAAIGLFIKPYSKVFSVIGLAGGVMTVFFNVLNLISTLQAYLEYDIDLDWYQLFGMPIVTNVGLICLYTALTLIAFLAHRLVSAGVPLRGYVPECVLTSEQASSSPVDLGKERNE